MHETMEKSYKHVLASFVPGSINRANLFHSSIKWADVGGLESVRQVLRDTLELPTKYAFYIMSNAIHDF